MKKISCLSLLLFILSNTIIAQSVDDSFSQKKMRKDFEIFKNIRLKANSGLYKYRTKIEMDSMYNWAEKQIAQSSTLGDFYNIICQVTDFEGSLHNDTGLPKKINQSLKNERHGYFPYPIKYIEGKWIVNYEKGKIELGAEIISINHKKLDDIVKNLYKYYTTDGVNTTGKRIGIERKFSKYYRLNYGITDTFLVKYKKRDSDKINSVNIKSIELNDYNKKIENRYSKPFDEPNYKDWKAHEKYNYQTIDQSTGILTINDFGMGNEKDPRHLRFVSFLDSVFIAVKNNKIKNLIVDVRYNGGGTDPNDLVAFSYLAQRNFSENKQAWISFKKIPYLKYIQTKVPVFLRFLGVIKYNKWFQKQFYIEKNNRFYQGSLSKDHKIREPNKHAFKGNIYLLISPRIASAGSLFAAMVAGNKNTSIIGEETMGGYYGHNGHTPLAYTLPNSKIETYFSVVNLEQDVPEKANQLHNRGIIPDLNITQAYEDYLNHKDTQQNFVFDLINNNSTK